MSLSSPIASRTLAIVHITMYDAVNSITRKYKERAIQVIVNGDELKLLAGGKAAHVVLSHLFPRLCFRLNWETTVANVAAGVSRSNGIANGLEVANAVLALRANDGERMADDPSYNSNSTVPGRWRRTPVTSRMTRRELPGLPALLPRYGDVMPFGIPEPFSFVPIPPPGGAPAIDNAYVTEVKAIGSLDSTVRTREQSVIALFWANCPGAATPPGHLNIIAQIVSLNTKLHIEEKARLFALLNIALADAASAIFVNTPPFLSYISGHSTFSGAFEAVMKGFFTTDNMPFTIPSEEPELCPRTYSSFSQAAEEAASSRLYGGIHFHSDNEDGLSTGSKVGQYVFERYL